MKILHALLDLLFPPKCILCRKLLHKDQTDLCSKCRIEQPEYLKTNIKLSFVARWTALWYYKDEVRQSLLRYKFRNARHYAEPYGRLLAMKLLKEEIANVDVISWVPIGRRRLTERGFDQCRLIAESTGRELGMEPIQTLCKVKDTPPQSGIRFAEQRRANVMGVYKVVDPKLVQNKRILLLDDIITTGATVCECARVLVTAGAKEVVCAAVAAAPHDNKK